MNQFEFMVNNLENRVNHRYETFLYTDEDHENASLALVESILLNGYQVISQRVYKTITKKVTELVDEK